MTQWRGVVDLPCPADAVDGRWAGPGRLDERDPTMCPNGSSYASFSSEINSLDKHPSDCWFADYYPGADQGLVKLRN